MRSVDEERRRLEAALAKPTPVRGQGVSVEDFDPWGDVVQGIHGSYSSESDRIFVAALEAVRDHATFDFIEREGFAGELAIYVLSGHGYLEYGTSPRGGWWDDRLNDLLQPLIEKWTDYAAVQWAD